jgi:exopolyphosphatase/guanosine-5'-triphosphate,3'-diphosphate pyrophosphatase
VAALAKFGEIMDSREVANRAAMATSASRDASNREDFFDRAESALGTRPRLVDGALEARYAYAGATARWQGPQPWVVSDIGGGSTEFVTEDFEISIDIGSVRLTERWFGTRPISEESLRRARAQVRQMFEGVISTEVGSLLGVGGSWTEIGGMVGGAERDVDLATVTTDEVTHLVTTLAGMTVEETAHFPTLNPARAETILGGVLVAEAVMNTLGVDTATQSISDTLDGLAQQLLALT